MAFEPVNGPLPKLGLGCWLFGNSAPGSAEEGAALDVLREAYEAGVRHFDTAFDYGNGRSEELIGKAVGSRPDAIIASKMHLADPDSALRGLEACRSRIGRDSIDLFYIHWPKTGMDPRPMMEALETERSRGRLRYIGVSNFSARELDAVREVGKVDAYQVGYNLLWRWPEADVLPYCRKAGIALVTYSSLAQGLLTGKFPKAPRFEAGDPRPGTVFYDEKVWPHVYEALERMKAVAADSGCPLAHLALKWLTDYVGVDLVLAGARTVDQLRENIRAMEASPPRGAFELLDSISIDLKPFVPDIGNMFKFYP
jgi:aryl-alcohol dehydrogenase-like predicted oxidoreductase